MLNFVKDLFLIYSDDHLIFVLYTIYVLYHVLQLEYFNLSLYPMNENNLIMVRDLVLCCLMLLISA
jgi:hypothetical protein